MRYIELDETSLEMLREMNKNHPNFVMRRRAQTLLYSHKRFQIKQIAELLEVERKTITRCFDSWEQDGLIGLYTQKGQGAKSIFNQKEAEKIKKIVKDSPRKIDMAKIEEKTGKTASQSTIKRALKRLNMVWKRVRQSLKPKRNEEDFQAAKEELASLKKLEDEGKIDLIFFDECGYSTVSNVPYAWQEKGINILLNRAKSQLLKITGFMKRDNTLEFYTSESTINSKVVCAFFDDFCNQLKQEYKDTGTNKVAYIIIDNASTHTSNLFKAKIKEWESDGNIIIKRLPTYSPELNLIEILWRFVKYTWMPFDAYETYEKLEEFVLDILSKFGQEKYTIKFE